MTRIGFPLHIDHDLRLRRTCAKRPGKGQR